MNASKSTANTYGFLWSRSDAGSPPEKWHYTAMQEVFDEPIVRGRVGIEIGSGCGYDTYIMAKDNPSVVIVSTDISDGIYNTKKITAHLKNVFAVKCSALAVPVKSESFDFAYSFGVLHHTIDPVKGLEEIARVLRKGAPAFLYLYEDHSENPVKYTAIKIVAYVRLLTTRIPRRFLYLLSWIISPFVFILFTVPSRILKRFAATKNIVGGIPFNFGTGPFSLQKDLYDRLGAPIEYRFSRDDIYNIFAECGFCEIHLTRLRNTAGWVARGYKK